MEHGGFFTEDSKKYGDFLHALYAYSQFFSIVKNSPIEKCLTQFIQQFVYWNMSANFRQILELATTLSEEEYILLIKEFSTALAAYKNIQSDISEEEKALLESAKRTRSEVLSGKMGTISLQEAKTKLRRNAND